MKLKVRFLLMAAVMVILPSAVWAQAKPCDPIYGLPWWEDFQAYPHNTTPPTEPACWHFQGTNEPSIGSYNIHNGYLTCVLDLYSTGETWAVLQNPFDTTLTINHMQVTFSAGKSRNDASLNSDLIIGICKNPTNPVGNFTPLDTVLAIPYCSPDTMARFTVDFSGYNDTGRYFCFLTKPLLSSGINFLAIDSILFDFNDHCMVPQGLHVGFVTDMSATFGWHQYHSGHAQLEYKRVSDTAWVTNDVTGCSHTFSGVFSPNTPYMARLRQDCTLASNGWSDWSDTVYFTTDTVRCRMPQDLTITDIANTTASFHWTSGGTATQWELHVFNSAYDRTFTATTNSYTVTGLTHGTNYRVTVRSMCDASNASEWTDTIMITTSQCYPVSNVRATPTMHEAVITWAEGTNSTGEWEVVYGLPGFTEGTELGSQVVTGTPQATLSGLDSATTYVAKVRTLCEDGRYSEYMTVTFTTQGGSQQGIADAEGIAVAVYPNPAATSTTVAVKGAEGRVNVAIIALDGRILQTYVKDCPTDCEMVLDVEGLAKGAYLIRIYNDRINTVRKFNVAENLRW